MANYHFEYDNISRMKGQSAIRAVTYQSGERLRDDYYGMTYYKRRTDVLHTEILLPPNAPIEFYDRQTLWREVDKAENIPNTRGRSRTARRIIASLPNELTLDEQIELVREFVTENFVSLGMGADIAIHEVKDKLDPAKDNPHVHIILTARAIDRDGFCSRKNRDWDDWGTKNGFLRELREQWAQIQNRAYERKGLDDVRVSAKSYIDCGIFDREPRKYLQLGDMYLERRGIRTIMSDKNRDIETRNREFEEQKQRQAERQQERRFARTR